MESAGLTDLLKQEGSYTLFAPVDASFGTLTEEDITLLKSKPFVLYFFLDDVQLLLGLFPHSDIMSILISRRHQRPQGDPALPL